MRTKLILLCHGPTAAMRSGGFPGADEALDADGLRKVAAVAAIATDVILTSPALAARETADALGLTARVDDRLRDIDHGRWTGQGFADIHAEAPEALAAWLAAPAMGAPGGETLAALCARIDGWLGEQMWEPHTILAITHPMVIRAVIATACGLHPEGVTRFDIAPLSQAVLSYERTWRLQSMGR